MYRYVYSLNEEGCLCILNSFTDSIGTLPITLQTVFTSITGVQSHIDSLSHTIIMDSNSFNITTIDTSWSHNSRISTTKFKSLSLTRLKNWINTISKWQSISIREVPVSTMGTLISTTTCHQVSVAVNSITTNPRLTDVHIGMVSQSLVHECDIRSSLTLHLHHQKQREQHQLQG